MKTIALYSIKGGVGKSTAAVNLAYMAALNGIKTLLIDLDAQGAGSYLLNIEPTVHGKTKDLIKGSRDALEQIRASDYRNLDVLPARSGLRNLDTKLYDSKASLAPLMERLGREYDCLILDCPPQFGATGEAILEISDTIISPVLPNPTSARTVTQLDAFLRSKKIKAGPILMLFYMANVRKRIHADTMADLRAAWPDCLETIIPFSTDCEVMGQQQTPLAVCRPRGAANMAMIQLFNELQQRKVF